MPGCERPCRELKTVRRQESGTRGRCVPVETSQKRGSDELASVEDSTTRVDVGEDLRERICGSVA